MRRRHGWMAGKTIALDNVTLVSRRYKLIAKPDRLVRQGRNIIPEERKSAPAVRPWHRVQLGVTFLVIEDKFGVKPTHGFIITGDDVPHRVENDAELRALVLKLDAEMRAVKANPLQAIPVNPVRGQCPPCGQKANCGQARL
jgi:CRISPR-associated exonuclease Cas4